VGKSLEWIEGNPNDDQHKASITSTCSALEIRSKTKDLLREGNQKQRSGGQFGKTPVRHTSVLEFDREDRNGLGRKSRSLAAQ